MNGSGGAYLARCEMVLNNTAWKRVQDGCGPPDALSSLSAFQRLAKLAEPKVNPALVRAHIVQPVN